MSYISDGCCFDASTRCRASERKFLRYTRFSRSDAGEVKSPCVHSMCLLIREHMNRDSTEKLLD